jgi:lysophospholipase L1-like esterase
VRSLRPAGFALFFLALCELGLRLSLPPDERVLRDPLHPFGCFADDEQARLLSARAPEPGPGPGPGTGPGIDLVLLGDSVLASTDNAPGERLADALPPALTEALRRRLPAGASTPSVRVFTLAVGGARAADLYAALRRLEARLAARSHALSAQAPAQSARRLVVLLASNVIFSSQRHRQPAMAFPCLAEWLGEDGELRARLGLPPPPSGVLERSERSLGELLTRNLYLFQQRRRVSERLFGEENGSMPPRQALRERLTELGRRIHGSPARPTEDAAYRNRPWSERGLSPAHYRAHYDLVPPGTPEATNQLASARTARFLAEHPGLDVRVIEIPQNHALVGRWTGSAAYSALQQQTAERFTAAGTKVLRYDRTPALRSEHFLDLDHLTAEGNRALAALLAADLAPGLSR